MLRNSRTAINLFKKTNRAFSLIPRRKNRPATQHDEGSSVSQWNPFSDPFFSDPFFNSPVPSMFNDMMKMREVRFPEVDISRTDKGLKIEANVPGFKKDEVDISIDGRWITISGEKSESSERKQENYHVMERSQGSFTRTFHLPEDARLDEITASMDNGVLVLEVPATEVESSEKKKIEIN